MPAYQHIVRRAAATDVGFSRWLGAMNAAGYPYTPLTATARAGTWPNGAKLAVVVCVGVESYRFGDGRTEDVLADVPAPDLVNTAWRDYGNRVGAFRLFDLLAPPRYPADGVAQHRRLRRGARRARGGPQGLRRDRRPRPVQLDSLSGMAPEAERAYLADVADRIRAEEGSAPGGWSSPWSSQTPATRTCWWPAATTTSSTCASTTSPCGCAPNRGPLLTHPVRRGAQRLLDDGRAAACWPATSPT